MPRRRSSRSPNVRPSNRRSNFNSPQKRNQLNEPIGHLRRSRSPGRHHQRPAPNSRNRTQQINHINTASSFPRNARQAVKRSRSPNRRRHSASPANKKLPMRKSSPPTMRATKMSNLGRGTRPKRLSVSPKMNRRKQSPPTGRMDATNRRDTSRLTKRDYNQSTRVRPRDISPLKKENPENKQIESYRPDNEMNSFEQSEKMTNQMISFSSSVDMSPFRREMKRYQSNVDEMRNRRIEQDEYIDKQLLDDRLNEQGGSRPPYDPEELKKITVDIRRNIPRDSDTIVRRIVHPEDVILVRRPEEGNRPIFDRDEIKRGNLEREEEFREKRVVAIVRERGRSRSPIQTLAQHNEIHENFKVHRISNYDSQAFQSRPSLSDRWQHDRKLANNSSSEKLLVSVRPGSPQMVRKNYRSDDDDEDVHLYRQIPQGRAISTYHHDTEQSLRMTSGDSDERRPIPTNPHDLRHSLISRGRPIDLVDARHKILQRQEPARSYERKSRSGSYERNSNWDNRDRSGEKMNRDEKLEGNFRRGISDNNSLPNFAARRDKYQYKEWIDKPDVVPKGPSYFEHDTRGEASQEFRRGRGGISRASSFRSRGVGGGGYRGRGAGGRGVNLTANYLTRRYIERGRSDQVSGLGNPDSSSLHRTNYLTNERRFVMQERDRRTSGNTTCLNR